MILAAALAVTVRPLGPCAPGVAGTECMVCHKPISLHSAHQLARTAAPTVQLRIPTLVLGEFVCLNREHAETIEAPPVPPIHRLAHCVSPSFAACEAGQRNADGGKV